MEECALLAPHLVVAFHASIRALGDDEVSQNVHINLPLDVVSDYSENQPHAYFGIIWGRFIISFSSATITVTATHDFLGL